MSNKITIDRSVLEQALDALELIALAGMSGCGQESEEGMRAMHARKAWQFISIAARALDPLKKALEHPAAVPLADEQITAIYDNVCGDWTDRYDRPVVFARAVEAAHKIGGAE